MPQRAEELRVDLQDHLGLVCVCVCAGVCVLKVAFPRPPVDFQKTLLFDENPTPRFDRETDIEWGFRALSFACFNQGCECVLFVP